MASSSSSSPVNWEYDVFPSFRGEDVRINFLAHFLKELDRRLIRSFIDNNIKRGELIDPELKKAIWTSTIAVVILSKNYVSSSWCLNELLEIVKCQKELGQMVIPVFYDLDPSDVRKQTGGFGEIFEKTCQGKKEDEVQLWRKALSHVANLTGYHSKNWDNEANLIEDITTGVLKRLLIMAKDFNEDYVGIENHMVKMSELLHLESKEVRMVGIWGPSGIGKTTIARALLNRLFPWFQGSSIFIDMSLSNKSKKNYSSANSDDYNRKLYLQRQFLSKLLEKKDIKIDDLGAVEHMLKHKKVLVVIDDLDDQAVLDALVGKTHWFGSGSRIIVITKDKHFLRAHGINHIYEVCLPSDNLALEMFCRSAFKRSSPPKGLMKLTTEVALLAGNLPLGLSVLGSYLRGRKKKDWIRRLHSLRDTLNGEIERTLKVSYDGLKNKSDKAVFRHIACLFVRESSKDVRLLLEDSKLDVYNALKNLAEKSLIHVRNGVIEMHHLLQDMGKNIVLAQSNEPGEREFLVDSKEICDVLKNNSGTGKVLGIALDMDEIEELHIHGDAFKGMPNLFFLKFYTKNWDKKSEVRWNLPKGLDSLASTELRFLRLDKFPLTCMSNFYSKNLVKLQMQDSKLEKLWDGVQSLTGLREMDLQRSKNLVEIPDLSMATNLRSLELGFCSSLVKLSSSIQYLHKLKDLNMESCKSLETLPTGMNLRSLYRINLKRCSKLKTFPSISTNISTLVLDETAIDEFHFILHLKRLLVLSILKMKSIILWAREQPLTPLLNILSPTLERLFISDVASLVELPHSIQNFRLDHLDITDCTNLESIPTGINLPYLYHLNLSGCSRLRTFPDISTTINNLHLERTGIIEVPWWVENFSRLSYLTMNGCNKLKHVSLHFSKLTRLASADFSNCGSLTETNWNGSPNVVAMATDNHNALAEAASFQGKEYFPKVEFSFINCFSLDKQSLIQQQSDLFHTLHLSGEEMPSYFTDQTRGTSFTNIPLLRNTLSRQFLKIKACALVYSESVSIDCRQFGIRVCCQFIDKDGNHLDSADWPASFDKIQNGSQAVVFDCRFPLNKANSHYVDIQFLLTDFEFKLRGCGIRLCEDEGSIDDNFLTYETDYSEQSEDSDDSASGNETDHSEQSEDSDDSGTGNETDHTEESEDSDVETNRRSKRIRLM